MEDIRAEQERIFNIVLQAMESGMKINALHDLCKPIYDMALKAKAVDIRERRKVKRRNFITADELADIIKVKKEGDIIVYVTNTNQYILFENYDSLRNYISEDDDFADKKEIKYQVVFGDEKQKLIFGYDSDTTEKDIEIISPIIKECFGVDPKIIYNEHYKCHQIVIDKQITKYHDGFQHFIDLHGKIKNKHPELVPKLRQLIPDKERYTDREYIMPVLDMKNGEWKDVIAGLLTDLDPNRLPQEAKNIIIARDNNVINITINNIINAKDGPNIEKITSDWISINCPNGFLKQEYYKYYFEYMSSIKLKPLNIKDFTKLVENTGFHDARKGSKHIWKSNEQN